MTLDKVVGSTARRREQMVSMATPKRKISKRMSCRSAPLAQRKWWRNAEREELILSSASPSVWSNLIPMTALMKDNQQKVLKISRKGILFVPGGICRMLIVNLFITVYAPGCTWTCDDFQASIGRWVRYVQAWTYNHSPYVNCLLLN